MDALKEPGVIGLANTLVKTEEKYKGVTAYLLGRVIVTENIVLQSNWQRRIIIPFIS